MSLASSKLWMPSETRFTRPHGSRGNALPPRFPDWLPASPRRRARRGAAPRIAASRRRWPRAKQARRTAADEIERSLLPTPRAQALPGRDQRIHIFALRQRVRLLVRIKVAVRGNLPRTRAGARRARAGAARKVHPPGARITALISAAFATAPREAAVADAVLLMLRCSAAVSPAHGRGIADRSRNRSQPARCARDLPCQIPICDERLRDPQTRASAITQA